MPGHTVSEGPRAPVEVTGNTGGDGAVNAAAADPWGLEQRGDAYELSTYSGKEVAELRHIKLLRQAGKGACATSFRSYIDIDIYIYMLR